MSILSRTSQSGGVTDHGALTGLSGNDHPQYNAPIGAEWNYAGHTIPSKWLLENGASNLSRSTYAALFAALTFTDATCITASGDANVTMDDTGAVEVGYAVEGSGIPAGATVASVDSATQITLSANATATASNVTLRFMPHGHGDDSSTFAIPDMRGEFARGHDAGRGVDSGRAFGSAQLDELKSHDHQVYFQTNNVASGTNKSNLGSSTVNDGAALSSARGGDETRPRNVAKRWIIYAGV